MLRWIGKLLIGVVAVALVALAFGAYRYQQFVEAPMTVEEGGYRLIVPTGSSLRQVAGKLQGDGLIDNALLLRVHGRLTGTAARIKAGEYAIRPGTTPAELVRRLVAGEVVQHGLTVVEGWTFKQMMAAVAAHDVLEQTLDGANPEQIMARLGAPGEHPEGWFYPETYHFPRGTTDLEFLQRAYTVMRERLEAEWAARSEGLPLETPYEALILASIIERETAVPAERDRIAGVFVRRLQRGMRLQTDPTVIYGMGDAYDGDIRYRDLRRDTPYNTYTRSGLPPTPIALPSGESIHAALHPADGDELYFVARGDGSHVFSATLEEHNRAVRRYQLRGKQ